MAKIATYVVVLVGVAVIAESNASSSRCPINQTWSNCPSSCPLTCKNPRPVDACIQLCQPNGCVCKRGFVRKGQDCVRLQDC